MTTTELADRIKSIAALAHARVLFSILRAEPDTIRICNDDDIVVTYDMLETLASLVGSKKINLCYRAEEPGWSEYTPGFPAEFSIVISYPPGTIRPAIPTPPGTPQRPTP